MQSTEASARPSGTQFYGEGQRPRLWNAPRRTGWRVSTGEVSEIDRRGLYIDVGDQMVDQSCAHRAVAQWVDPPRTVARRGTEAMRFGTPASTVMAILGVVHDP